MSPTPIHTGIKSCKAIKVARSWLHLKGSISQPSSPSFGSSILSPSLPCCSLHLVGADVPSRAEHSVSYSHHLTQYGSHQWLLATAKGNFSDQGWDKLRSAHALKRVEWGSLGWAVWAWGGLGSSYLPALGAGQKVGDGPSGQAKSRFFINTLNVVTVIFPSKNLAKVEHYGTMA